MKFSFIPRKFRNPYATTAALIVWCGMFGVYLFDLQTYADAEQWPSVSGELISGEIEEVERRPSTVSIFKYRLNLQYRYEVAGTIFENDKIQILDDDYATKSAADSELQRYRGLPTLTVYYSESDPATSILEPKTPRHSGIFLLLAGGVAVILAGMTAFSWWRKFNTV